MNEPTSDRGTLHRRANARRRLGVARVKPVDCSLTVLFPEVLQEEPIDLRHEQPAWVGGFNITHLEGAGWTVRLSGALHKTEAEGAVAYSVNRSAYDNWRNLQAAAEQLERGAAMTARAYALGEAGLTDLLIARRQAIEARLAATVARMDAAEAR